jgi:hypothetical protein
MIGPRARLNTGLVVLLLRTKADIQVDTGNQQRPTL